MLKVPTRYNKAKMRGFTITELMIATSILSILLLIGAAAFSNLGSTYYKGYTITQTQEVAKQIINEVSSNIRLSSTVQGPLTSGASDYYCIGAHRYTYMQYNSVDSSQESLTNFGLREDQPNGCADPLADDSQAPLTLNGSTELLPTNTRLLNFKIAPVAGVDGTYSIILTVAAGADSALTQDGQSTTAQCLNQVQINRFCSVSSLHSVVHQGASL